MLLGSVMSSGYCAWEGMTYRFKLDVGNRCSSRHQPEVSTAIVILLLVLGRAVAFAFEKPADPLSETPHLAQDWLFDWLLFLHRSAIAYVDPATDQSSRRWTGAPCCRGGRSRTTAHAGTARHPRCDETMLTDTCCANGLLDAVSNRGIGTARPASADVCARRVEL